MTETYATTADLFILRYVEELCVYIPKNHSHYHLRVYNKKNKVYFLKVIPVKEAWTDIEDFPYEDIYIETADLLKKKSGHINILAHILISKQTGSMLSIGSSSRKFWRKKHVYDYSVGGGDRIKTLKNVCPKMYLKPIEKMIQYIKYH